MRMRGQAGGHESDMAWVSVRRGDPGIQHEAAEATPDKSLWIVLVARGRVARKPLSRIAVHGVGIPHLICVRFGSILLQPIRQDEWWRVVTERFEKRLAQTGQPFRQ